MGIINAFTPSKIFDIFSARNLYRRKNIFIDYGKRKEIGWSEIFFVYFFFFALLNIRPRISMKKKNLFNQYGRTIIRFCLKRRRRAETLWKSIPLFSCFLFWKIYQFTEIAHILVPLLIRPPYSNQNMSGHFSPWQPFSRRGEHSSSKVLFCQIGTNREKRLTFLLMTDSSRDLPYHIPKQPKDVWLTVKNNAIVSVCLNSFFVILIDNLLWIH